MWVAVKLIVFNRTNMIGVIMLHLTLFFIRIFWSLLIARIKLYALEFGIIIIDYH